MTKDAAPLARHLELIEAEYAEARAMPLSARQAMLVAVLLDKFADRVFFANRFTAPERVFFAEDVLAFRAELARRTPALATIFALCAQNITGPRLATKAVAVPIADYHKLPVEDFMVSLYNGNTVQRVVITGDGAERLAHEVLTDAMAWARGVAAAEA